MVILSAFASSTHLFQFPNIPIFFSFLYKFIKFTLNDETTALTSLITSRSCELSTTNISIFKLLSFTKHDLIALLNSLGLL